MKRFVFCIHTIIAEELRIRDGICNVKNMGRLRSPLSDNGEPSDTLFDLHEVDETIREANDVPHLPCWTFPVQVEISLGQREESENRILLEHITHNDAAPEIDPSNSVCSEKDHLVGLAWQVP